jgi:hypothetical protein
MPFFTMPDIVKRSGFKRLLKSDTQSKASTLSLNIALVRKEKSGLIIITANLKNKIIIMISGILLKACRIV